MATDSNASRTNHATNWLKRVARGSAWVLLVSILILLFSGWGITQTGVIYKFTFGLVDRRAADLIHRATNIPLAVFFLTHVMANIRLSVPPNRSFLRWLVDGILIAVGIGIMIIVVYLEYFRTGG